MKLILASAVAAYVLTGDWLAALAAAVLGLLWLILGSEASAGPPVLFFAMAYQWNQVAVGLFYEPISGRTVQGSQAPEFRTMALIGLACVVVLSVGISMGIRWTRPRWPARPLAASPFSVAELVVVYFAGFAMTGVLQAMSVQYTLFAQALIVLSLARLGVFYLIVRRLLSPDLQLPPLAGLLAFELGIGLTGFFASFREPLLLTGLAFLETFDRRRLSHWVAVTALLSMAATAGLFWIGVRGDLRADYQDVEQFAESRAMRFARIQQLGREWAAQDWQETLWSFDELVDRQWVLYYPALAVARVPSVLPHTNGELFRASLAHILMPRVLFPDKPALPSESSLVRRYSGVWVAGEEQGTSIAFGYAAESYVDFGLPGMFLPVLGWGLFVGVFYQLLCHSIRHRQLLAPLLVVVFWIGLFLFERSWAKMMGTTGTLLIYLGGATYFLDRWLLMRQSRMSVRADTPATAPLTHAPS